MPPKITVNTHKDTLNKHLDSKANILKLKVHLTCLLFMVAAFLLAKELQLWENHSTKIHENLIINNK